MSKSTELYKEARRCADHASRGVSPKLFYGLAKFYETLAETEPNEAQVKRGRPGHRMQSKPAK